MVLGKKHSKITLNFDSDQHFQPYLENELIEVDAIFMAAHYQWKEIISKVWFLNHHFKSWFWGKNFVKLP